MVMESYHKTQPNPTQGRPPHAPQLICVPHIIIELTSDDWIFHINLKRHQSISSLQVVMYQDVQSIDINSFHDNTSYSLVICIQMKKSEQHKQNPNQPNQS